MAQRLLDEVRLGCLWVRLGSEANVALSPTPVGVTHLSLTLGFGLEGAVAPSPSYVVKSLKGLVRLWTALLCTFGAASELFGACRPAEAPVIPGILGRGLRAIKVQSTYWDLKWPLVGSKYGLIMLDIQPYT